MTKLAPENNDGSEFIKEITSLRKIISNLTARLDELEVGLRQSQTIGEIAEVVTCRDQGESSNELDTNQRQILIDSCRHYCWTTDDDSVTHLILRLLEQDLCTWVKVHFRNLPLGTGGRRGSPSNWLETYNNRLAKSQSSFRLVRASIRNKEVLELVKTGINGERRNNYALVNISDLKKIENVPQYLHVS